MFFNSKKKLLEVQQISLSRHLVSWVGLGWSGDGKRTIFEVLPKLLHKKILMRAFGHIYVG